MQVRSPNTAKVPDVDPGRTTTHIGFSPAAIVNGGSALYCGDIGELLVYAKALSGAERTAVEAYLKTRWGP